MFIDLNRGGQFLNFEMMKLLLSKIGFRKYQNLNENNKLAETLWETLKTNPNDQVIHIEKIANLISNPSVVLPKKRRKSNEENKSQQSGLTKIRPQRKVPVNSKKPKIMKKK